MSRDYANTLSYELLTWKHPRASGLILFTLLGSLIFSQSVNVPKFAFRILWVVLGSATTLEVATQFAFRNKEGFVTKFAPKQYLTLERSQIDPVVDELFSLVNFFLAEAQRLLFVRDPKHTSVAFVLSFVAYNLIKFLSLTALVGVGIVFAFALPPIYLRHRQVIDAQLTRAQELSSQHYQNAKNVASKQAEAAGERARTVAIDLGNKVGVNVQKYIDGPGPVMSESVHAELAKQPKEPAANSNKEHKMTNAPTEAVSAFTAKVPESGEGVADIPKSTQSPPVEEHVQDTKTHDEHLKPAESVQNNESIPI